MRMGGGKRSAVEQMSVEQVATDIKPILTDSPRSQCELPLWWDCGVRGESGNRANPPRFAGRMRFVSRDIHRKALSLARNQLILSNA